MLRSLLSRGRRGLGLAALLLFAAGTAFAQTGRIEGTVRSANTGDPIQGARVTVMGTDLAGVTNANGYYAIANVPVGTYEVRANVVGFQRVTITNQSVAAGLPTVVNFSLAASILRIEGVVVTGVAEEQAAVKLPFTVDRIAGEELQVPASNAEETIRGKVAGAKVVRGSGRPGDGSTVLLRGMTSIDTDGRSNEPLYVVDGVILGASMVDIDALNIESIEVVKGAAAAALYGARAANGVIQIRTQRGRNIPEGETRITVRTEFGRNLLQREFPLIQSHHYKTDGTNWLAEAGEDGPVGDTAITRYDTTFDAATGEIVVGQNGVVQITTPRDLRAVDWRYDSADVDGDGTFEEQWRYAVSDKAFPTGTQLFNQMDRFFDPGTYYTNQFNVSHRTGSTNFLASFHETKESGVIGALNGYLRRGARLNVDHRIARRLDFNASAFFSQSKRDTEAGDNPNPFFSLVMLPPDVDLLERYPASQAKIDACDAAGGDPAAPECVAVSVRDSNDYLIIPAEETLEESPLYLVNNQDIEETRGRFLASLGIRWRPLDAFDFEGNFSFDRSDRNTSEYWFKGYRTFDPSTLRDGRLRKISAYSQALNGSVTATFTQQFGDLNTVTKARLLIERNENESVTARSTQLVVNDVQDLDNSDADLQRVFGSTSEVHSLGYFLSTQLDYGDRYIVDALVRRDGSSLFGSEQRWHWYYRIGGAWRLAQESWWPFGGVDEFKLRASRGTAGGRPQFSAQYETFSISGSSVTKDNLGNKNLAPESASETELGVDLIALGRFSLSVSYAASTVEDQILPVPLPSPQGYSTQWRNAGTLSTNTWEATLQAALVQKPDFGWTAGVVWDRTRGRLDSLATPPFFLSDFHYIRQGDEIGLLYGSKWATSCSDMLHSGSDLDGDGAGDRQFYTGDECLVGNGGGFDMNDDGYLVPVGAGMSWTDGIDQNQWGRTLTIDSTTYTNGFGIPVKGYTVRESELEGGVLQVDTTRFQVIGNSMPDFNLGFTNSFRWKGFSVYTLFDAQVGGDIYNNTRQWGCRDLTCWEYDQVNQDGRFASGSADQPANTRKSILYGEILYDVNDNNNHWIEKGTYLKFRELAVRYTIGRGPLEGIMGGLFKGATFSIIGRNLMTFTDYSGYDPEVSTSGNAAYLRVDARGYPNYRTWTGSVELTF
jgi:TonB-linked SusC/RagA family outer membrane protein